jgi:hypothetical protein
MIIKRWVSENDGTMVEDDRSMQQETVRLDSYVLATDYFALVAEMDLCEELNKRQNEAIGDLRAELARYSLSMEDQTVASGEVNERR